MKNLTRGEFLRWYFGGRWKVAAQANLRSLGLAPRPTSAEEAGLAWGRQDRPHPPSPPTPKQEKDP
jgi:hypothetical protein